MVTFLEIFEKIFNMNKGIVIITSAIIIIIILGLTFMINQESEMIPNNTSDNENDYKPLPKNWQISGPFQIDRSEYAIGEKIFIVSTGLQDNDKGEIIFLRPINATHNTIWDKVPFDGSKKSELSMYVEPKISKFDKICTLDDIVGEWFLIFNGTNYPTLSFTINEKIVPGTYSEPAC